MSKETNYDLSTMTKQEYLDILKKKLNRLPKIEYDKAMEYFNEYFEDAGPENEQEAIQNLGDPVAAGDQIILDLAIKNTQSEEKPKTVKKSMNAVWIAVLAVLACPVALPIAIGLVSVMFAIVVSIGAVLFGLLAGVIGMLIAVPVAIVGSFSLIPSSFPAFMCTIGVAILALGLGAALIYGIYLLAVKLISLVADMFGNYAKKRKEKQGGGHNE